ncbi:MAG TPA: SGNH/GDSL hydrolase family protein [Blastocatellia bacterium]|nr:SGNH/GDSL hydrolase family protein [Blastocatellia bacterium]
MKHLVLIGDSIFDNQAYINGGADVTAHLINQMPSDWKATLRAVDGSTVETAARQISGLPGDATHLIVSAGGNNAILHADILQEKARSSAEVLIRLAEIANEFEDLYRSMLQDLLSLKKSTAVCTIYYPQFPEPSIQKSAVAALTVFNDAIIRQAFLAGVPLIDLRLVCNEQDDYANEIEPSEKGGGKIAAAILRLVENHNFEKRRTEVFF